MIWKQNNLNINIAATATANNNTPVYVLLRKLRTELCSTPIDTITSIHMVPSTTSNVHLSSSLIVVAPCNNLVMFSLSTYKPTVTYAGYHSALNMQKIGMSADGRLVLLLEYIIIYVYVYIYRYVICGCVDSTNAANTIIRIWDTQTGNMLDYIY